MRDSFTFYRSFAEGLKEVDDATFRRLVESIMNYALDDEEPELSGLEKGMYLAWKANVDASNQRRDNGKLGGRPPKEKTIGFEDENHRLSDEKPNKNMNIKEKENINNISCAEEPHENLREQEERDRRNFEKIYALYPKKVGKTNAFIAYKQWISKNGKSIGGKRHHLTPEQIFKAVKKYVDHQTDNGTQMEYWKNFDTLMGRQLLDYVEEKNDTS